MLLQHLLVGVRSLMKNLMRFVLPFAYHTVIKFSFWSMNERNFLLAYFFVRKFCARSSNFEKLQELIFLFWSVSSEVDMLSLSADDKIRLQGFQAPLVSDPTCGHYFRSLNWRPEIKWSSTLLINTWNNSWIFRSQNIRDMINRRNKPTISW